MTGGEAALALETPSPARAAGRLGTAVRVAAGLAVLLVAFALPAQPSGEGALHLPVEWFWAIGLLALARGRAFALLAAAIVSLAASTAVLKLADWGTILAFSRPFDPVSDRPIVIAAWHLLAGSVGGGRALLAVGGGLFALALAVGLAAWGTTGIRTLGRRARRILAAGGLAGGAVGTALLLALPAGFAPAPLSAGLEAYVVAKATAMRRSLAARAAFERELADDPLSDAPPADLFSALAGRDVLVLFVESYGRSAVEDPRYAPRTTARLRAVEASLATAGISARSGWMGSPIAGGQSWLAHATLLSGLQVGDQARYAALLESRRASLNALFRSAGWRTVAVMPAITMPWPEAAWFGFDEILAARDLDYRGLPFDWVTMPDQFTLRKIGEVLNRPGPPVMLEAALISSHAPWTPIPRMVPWSEIGDGAIFDEQARGGEAPQVLWRDAGKVRRNYGLSIDYALEAVGSFVPRFAKRAVVVVLGDHQPAELVTGPGASRDVPVHILSDDPEILRRLDGLGITAGMIPAAAAPSHPMSTFRETFVRAMSGGAPPS